MKKRTLTLSALLTLSIHAAFAQQDELSKPKPAIQKGTFTIGTGIGLANLAMSRVSPGQTNYMFDIQFQPSVGYFVTDNLMLSASMFGGLAQNHNIYGEPGRYNSSSVGMSVGGRYFFGKGLSKSGEVKKVRFYADASAGYSQQWEKFRSATTGRTEASRDGYAFASLGAGMNYFIAPNVAFETGLTYNRFMPTNWKALGDATVQVNLGIRVYLRKK